MIFLHHILSSLPLKVNMGKVSYFGIQPLIETRDTELFLLLFFFSCACPVARESLEINMNHVSKKFTD